MIESKILIIDDDIDILKVLKANLELQGYKAYTARNWQEGRELINKVSPDLIILDLMLPDGDGLTICNEIKKERIQLPIIILTARDKLSDKILGLESGADDYIVKPFETLELFARIKACLRRAKPIESVDKIEVRGLFIDFKKRIVTVEKKEILLTHKEFNLLSLLIMKKGEVISRDEIKRHLWKDSQLYSWSRVIDVHIQRLRQKLDNKEFDKFIETVPGMGYRFKN
ncbi:MAG TPA: response regulator transcription factor [Nitrospirae bacterium]|nr:response regulator transcription factor [Nitrospirota bacterium]